jgi:hypothetical protein
MGTFINAKQKYAEENACFTELSQFYMLQQACWYYRLEGKKKPRLFSFIGMPQFSFLVIVPLQKSSTKRRAN